MAGSALSKFIDAAQCNWAAFFTSLFPLNLPFAIVLPLICFLRITHFFHGYFRRRCSLNFYPSFEVAGGGMIDIKFYPLVEEDQDEG